MSYAAFSTIYDRMIAEDVDYGKICDFIENVFIDRGIAPVLIADLACGTGGVTLPLAARGYDMIGIDRSFDMLDIAGRKDKEHKILFLNQSIENLDLYGTVGAALCMTDGFNYVLSDKTLLSALKRLRTCFMDKGGVLIFDVSTEHKLKNVLADKTFVYDTDDIFYAWENKYYPKKKLCEMTINFFNRTKRGYRRITERQLQRARSTKEIKRLLVLAGFVNVECYSSTSFSPEREDAERLWFVCENPK
ncbi:MAG: methyltransferase domain-containing protein [Eubacteriales bacterium]|nr:methyltransferase domain-containing protein [Eubacteriales bacterium]